MIQHYFYDGQIRSYLLQFVSIFNGLHVMTGRSGDDACGDPEFIPVPVVIGNKDRVVAAIGTGNTQNRVFSLPAMAAYLTGLTPSADRRRAPGLVDQRVTMRTGGVFPDDLTVVKRVMPVPYDATIELSIYASNTQQLHQILEQILVLFNPDLQIQKSDGPFDWTRITRVELTDIANEENYPSGQDRRIIVWSLSFLVPIYLSIPMGVKDDLVRKVIIQIGDLAAMNVNEVDENGELQPFGDPLATIVFDTTADPTDPDYYMPPPKGEEPFPPDQVP